MGAALLASVPASSRWNQKTLLPAGMVGVALLLAAWKPISAPSIPTDAAILKQHVRATTSFRGIYEAKKCLPTPSTIYHSEIGVVGLIFPDSRVVDLAGLQSAAVAEGHATLDAQCQNDQPELLFLPHKNYAELNATLAQSACLKNYVRVVERSSSPLHVRKDLAPAFQSCATNLDFDR
jgi:hypothetical protein